MNESNSCLVHGLGTQFAIGMLGNPQRKSQPSSALPGAKNRKPYKPALWGYHWDEIYDINFAVLFEGGSWIILLVSLSLPD